jgi:hypothetical protein
VSLLPLAPDQEAEAGCLTEILMKTVSQEVRAIVELLASKPDHQLLGQTEFEGRDGVHTIGAQAIATALNERKKGVPGVQPELPDLVWSFSDD